MSVVSVPAEDSDFQERKFETVGPSMSDGRSGMDPSGRLFHENPVMPTFPPVQKERHSPASKRTPKVADITVKPTAFEKLSGSLGQRGKTTQESKEFRKGMDPMDLPSGAKFNAYLQLVEHAPTFAHE